MIRNRIVKGALVLTALLVLGLQVGAQQTESIPNTPQQPAQSAPKKKAVAPRTPSPVIVETSSDAPQVVTLLHSVSGLEMFRRLSRMSDVRAVGRVDNNFKFNGEVHINVIAGLALDDGETVAAWLPEVDPEMTPAPAWPATSLAPTTAPVAGAPAAGVNGTPKVSNAENAAQLAQRFVGVGFETPKLTVIARDRKRLTARYIGLDGVTGLSFVKLGKNTFPGLQSIVEANEKQIVVGQRVHLYGPERAPESGATTAGPVYVRIAETEGKITKLMRGPSGTIARVQIKSPKVSTLNIGGVAINDAGETLGIVDGVKGTEATILPTTVIKGAARRVLERQASVPRPWLGVGGEPLGAFPVEQLLKNGWETKMAKSLAEQVTRGILVTSVLPGSPAFKASLKPGDVILSANEDAIQSAEEFSWVLEEAGPGGSLRFTVAKPGKAKVEAVDVKLSESPDPNFNLRNPVSPQAYNVTEATKVYRYSRPDTLVQNGIETVALKPRVAAKLGSTGGLLVVYVEPDSVAYKAGLKAGDVIESINGQSLGVGYGFRIRNASDANYTCSIVRNKQKLVLTVKSAKTQPSKEN